MLLYPRSSSELPTVVLVKVVSSAAGLLDRCGRLPRLTERRSDDMSIMGADGALDPPCLLDAAALILDPPFAVEPLSLESLLPLSLDPPPMDLAGLASEVLILANCLPCIPRVRERERFSALGLRRPFVVIAADSAHGL